MVEEKQIEDGTIIFDDMQAMICSLNLLNEYLMERGIK